jgi:peptidoglycan-N-acetylglucosamine deacetylase
MTATPRIFDIMYPKRVWRKPADKKIIYLTFDDGPIADITPWVLETLQKYNAKATFFVVGENVIKNPQILKETKSAGHQIGNHTYNHLNGWKTANMPYLENVRMGKNTIEDILGTEIRQFRPPYGRLTPTQATEITHSQELIMWSVLSKDYDQKLSPQKCLENTINASQNGSIVLFHDSIKAENNIKQVLPHYLDYFSQKGFTFEAL